MHRLESRRRRRVVVITPCCHWFSGPSMDPGFQKGVNTLWKSIKKSSKIAQNHQKRGPGRLGGGIWAPRVEKDEKRGSGELSENPFGVARVSIFTVKTEGFWTIHFFWQFRKKTNETNISSKTLCFHSENGLPGLNSPPGWAWFGGPLGSLFGQQLVFWRAFWGLRFRPCFWKAPGTPAEPQGVNFDCEKQWFLSKFRFSQNMILGFILGVILEAFGVILGPFWWKSWKNKALKKRSKKKS